jgi:hypothetical protein
MVPWRGSGGDDGFGGSGDGGSGDGGGNGSGSNGNGSGRNGNSNSNMIAGGAVTMRTMMEKAVTTAVTTA